MVVSQTWLNNNYPKDKRSNVTNLLICDASELGDKMFCDLVLSNFSNKHFLDVSLSESLTGDLDLTDFVNLVELYIKGQYITSLKLTSCLWLSNLQVSSNMLQRIDWPSSNVLETIDVSNNNFIRQNLSCFSPLTNLVYLYLGIGACEYFTVSKEEDEVGTEPEVRIVKMASEVNNVNERIRNNIYNRWYGSLIYLKDLGKLKELNINGTDINSGLEYLPSSLNNFMCGNSGRVTAGVEEIKEICNFSEELALSSDIDDNQEKKEAIIAIISESNILV